MKSTPAEIDKILNILNENLHCIARTSNLSEAKLHFSPDKQTWSIAEIFAHLRSCNDIWTHSIFAMLTEENPILPDINERKWARVVRYEESPFHDSLQVFRLQRGNLLRVLHGLSIEQWERSAIIFERKHTIFTQARRMAKHEKEHCEQIEEILR